MDINTNYLHVLAQFHVPTNMARFMIPGACACSYNPGNITCGTQRQSKLCIVYPIPSYICQSHLLEDVFFTNIYLHVNLNYKKTNLGCCFKCKLIVHFTGCSSLCIPRENMEQTNIHNSYPCFHKHGSARSYRMVPER